MTKQQQKDEAHEDYLKIKSSAWENYETTCDNTLKDYHAKCADTRPTTKVGLIRRLLSLNSNRTKQQQKDEDWRIYIAARDVAWGYYWGIRDTARKIYEVKCKQIDEQPDEDTPDDLRGKVRALEM